MKSDLLDLTVCLHMETERAVLVSDVGDEKRAVWIPKSQCECEKSGKLTKGSGASKNRTFPIATLTCPEWLASNKGLV